MAVTPTTLTELNELAKDYFSNIYVKAINNNTPLKASLGRVERLNYTGRKMIWGVKLQNGGGSSNAGANKSLPAAAAGVYDQAETTPVRTYTRMALDLFAAEVTKRQEGSFRPALAELMEDRLSAHDLEINRQMFCNGDGKLFGITTGAASADQTPGTGTAGAVGDYGVVNGGPGTKHVYVGDALAFYSNDGLTLRGRRTVTAVDHVAGTITVDSSVTTSDGDWATRSTPDTDSFTAGEAVGLLKGVSASGTLYNIPADYQGWKAISFTNGGTLRPVSDTLVMQVTESIRVRSGMAPDLIVTTPGIVLRYSELFLPIRRIDGQGAQLVGGYKPLNEVLIGGGSIPVIADGDCPAYRMFFLNTRCVRMADLVGTAWADMDGAMFDRVVDKDAVEGYIRKYWQVAFTQRNAHGLLGDIEDTITISKIA